MGFAFGAQTLVKAREDWIVTRGRKRGHVKAAAQSTSSAEDGAFTAQRTAVVIAEAGRFVDLDMALNEPYPGDK
jgi:hypothetical protein